jgi:hypothetical protein
MYIFLLRVKAKTALDLVLAGRYFSKGISVQVCGTFYLADFGPDSSHFGQSATGLVH